MGEYLKRSESVNLKSRAMTENLQLISIKKRKLYLELENKHGDVEFPENSLSPAASMTYLSSKSDNESTGRLTGKNSRSPDLENVDLQSEDFETEISSSIRGFYRQATPTSEICPEQWLMHSTSTSNRESQTAKERPGKEISVEKMPSEAELEEFFAAAEKCEQKRFAEKYNYDIVKDVPLEGKYEWVRLQ